MAKLIFQGLFILAFVLLAITFIKPAIEKKPVEKLYFEIKKRPDTILVMNGFIRLNGKYCPVVLKDSIAVIYR